jgi:hypothetical protein
VPEDFKAGIPGHADSPSSPAFCHSNCLETERNGIQMEDNGRALISRIAALEQRIAELEGGLKGVDDQTISGPLRHADDPVEPVDRRQVLKRLGVAAAGVAGLSVLSAERAAATDGAAVLAGTDNSATVLTAITVGPQLSASPTFAFAASGNAGSVVNGVFAAGTNIAVAASGGRLGLNIGSGTSHIRMIPTVPTNTEGAALLRGEMRTDTAGNLWFQHTDGANNALKLAGPAAAGVLHVVDPFRIYDSRSVAILSAGTSRVISAITVPGTPVPSTAKAIVATLTLTSTGGNGGFVTITAGDVASTGSSSANWFGPGQTLAVTVISKLDPSGQIKMFNNSAADTHFLLDVTGYYR